MTPWKELLDWCNRQGDRSVVEIVELLESHPEATRFEIVMILWTAATGDTGPDPDQSPAMVEKFYRRFPALPNFRPLLICPVCDLPPIYLLGLIQHLAQHEKTAGESAICIRQIWKELFV